MPSGQPARAGTTAGIRNGDVFPMWKGRVGGVIWSRFTVSLGERKAQDDYFRILNPGSRQLMVIDRPVAAHFRSGRHALCQRNSDRAFCLYF